MVNKDEYIIHARMQSRFVFQRHFLGERYYVTLAVFLRGWRLADRKFATPLLLTSMC